MRRPRESAGAGIPATYDPGMGHDLHGRPSGHQSDGFGRAWPRQQYTLQARKQIATLQKAQPGIAIEIRWCPVHKGVAGNEKADEWAKIAAEEPDARGVEWLSYLGRAEARAIPLPSFLANLKRDISEKKWVKARQ